MNLPMYAKGIAFRFNITEDKLTWNVNYYIMFYLSFQDKLSSLHSQFNVS